MPYLLSRNHLLYNYVPSSKTEIVPWTIHHDCACRFIDRHQIENLAHEMAYGHPGDLFQVLDAETMSVKFSVRWNN